MRLQIAFPFCCGSDQDIRLPNPSISSQITLALAPGALRELHLGTGHLGSPAVKHLVEKEEAKPQMSPVPSQCMKTSMRLMSFDYVHLCSE